MSLEKEDVESIFKKIYFQSRENGWFLAVIVILFNIRYALTISGSQKTANISLAELFISFGVCTILYLLCSQRYKLSKIGRNIILLTVVAGAVYLVSAGYHIFFNDKSIYEFIGVFRNIYGCIVLIYLIDAKIFTKEEIVAGIINIAVIYSITALAVFMHDAYIFELSKAGAYRWGRLIILDDNLAILCALMVMCVYFYMEKFAAKINTAKILLILTSALLGAVGSGSRSQALPILLVFFLLPLVFINNNAKRIIKIQAMTIFIVAIVITMVWKTTPNSNYMALMFFRGNPIVIEVASQVEGKEHILKESAKEYGMGTDDIDKKVSVSDLMKHGSSSADRSSLYRLGLISDDLRILIERPFFGTGQRVRTQAYSDGHVNHFYTPPNFILHIALLVGLPATLGYIFILGYIYIALNFDRNGLLLHEKMILNMASIPIFVLSLFHDGLAGGVALNLILWLIISYIYLVSKERTFCKINIDNNVK